MKTSHMFTIWQIIDMFQFYVDTITMSKKYIDFTESVWAGLRCCRIQGVKYASFVLLRMELTGASTNAGTGFQSFPTPFPE